MKTTEGKLQNIATIEQQTIAVNMEVPKELNKINKEDKVSFEDFKTAYKDLIDAKCIEDFGDTEDSKLWEDTAKDLFLQSKNYVMQGDEYKSKEDIDKKTESVSNVNEAYSEKLGGEPTDFITDCKTIRDTLNKIDTSKLGTHLAAQIIQEFEETVEDQIKMAKTKYNLEEGQYSNERRRGIPAITRTAETEYYDNEDWYKEHRDDYTNVSDFVEKEIAEIASEYNLSEEAAKKVCEKIFELMTNTKITESAKAFLPLDNYHSIAIEEINYGIDDTVTYAYYEGDKVIDGPFESKIEYEEDGTPYFLDEQGEKWMIGDFMRYEFTESKKQETTDKELQSMKAKIPNYTQVPYAEWTDEQKELDNIISCIRMIHSLLIYNYPNATEKDIEHILADKYLQEHIRTLSREKVRELLAQEIEEFKSATVHRDVYTDGEGVSYNSVKFKDESKTIKTESITEDRKSEILTQILDWLDYHDLTDAFEEVMNEREDKDIAISKGISFIEDHINNAEDRLIAFKDIIGLSIDEMKELEVIEDMNESKKVEAYTAQDMFDARYGKYGYKELARSNNNNYILVGKYDAEHKYFRIEVTKGSELYQGEIYIEHNKGLIQAATLNWASYGSTSIENAIKFANNLAEATEFAQSIEGKDFTSILTGEKIESYSHKIK